MAAVGGFFCLRTLMLLLFYLATVATAAPTTAISLLNDEPISYPPAPSTSVRKSDLSSRSLVKRHDYYIVCGKNPQDNDKKSGIKGPEDIPLARQCIASPYYYFCDRDGFLDYPRSTGEQLLECTVYCKCNKPANPPPLCLQVASREKGKACF